MVNEQQPLLYLILCAAESQPLGTFTKVNPCMYWVSSLCLPACMLPLLAMQCHLCVCVSLCVLIYVSVWMGVGCVVGTERKKRQKGASWTPFVRGINDQVFRKKKSTPSCFIAITKPDCWIHFWQPLLEYFLHELECYLFAVQFQYE